MYSTFYRNILIVAAFLSCIGIRNAAVAQNAAEVKETASRIINKKEKKKAILAFKKALGLNQVVELPQKATVTGKAPFQKIYAVRIKEVRASFIGAWLDPINNPEPPLYIFDPSTRNYDKTQLKQITDNEIPAPIVHEIPVAPYGVKVPEGLKKRIVAIDAQNVLLVETNEENMAILLNIIRLLDRPQPKVETLPNLAPKNTDKNLPDDTKVQTETTAE